MREEKLDADHQRFDARDQQEDQCITDVEDAELLVIDGNDPAMDHLEIRASRGAADACGRCPLRFLPSIGMPGVSVPICPSAPVYFKVSKIGGDLRILPVSQMHGGHQGARFELIRIVDPRLQVFRRIGHCACRQGLAAHQVCQIGPISSVGYRAGDGVAVDASLLLEDQLPIVRD